MLKKLWILFLFPILVQAQLYSPAKWSTQVKDLGNNNFEVQVIGKIENGWHLYSSKHPDGGIGIPASATFKASKGGQLVGPFKEQGKRIDKYSTVFEQDEKYYEKQVTFVQKVAVSGKDAVNVDYTIEFQMCDAERCLPPDETSGSVKITPKAIEQAVVESSTDFPTVENNTEEVAVDTIMNDAADTVVVQEDSIVTVNDTANTGVADDLLGENEKSNNSIIKIFVLGFLGGLAALLMPCIFPMIPLTVSMFTKQSKSKGEGVGKAFIYGLSIIIIYVGLGFLATVLFGASFLNEMATNPWVNLGFFAIFIVFAISFFGAFELTLPSKWDC